MAAVTYTGAERLTYSGYVDLATGRTLTADPGGTYDIAPVNAGPEVPADGRFVLVEEEEEVLPDDEDESLPASPEEEEETPAYGEER